MLVEVTAKSQNTFPAQVLDAMLEKEGRNDKKEYQR